MTAGNHDRLRFALVGFTDERKVHTGMIHRNSISRSSRHRLIHPLAACQFDGCLLVNHCV